MADDFEAIEVRIRGRVQGVGYRAWSRGQAIRLGLAGWVRNERDGSVTALIAGPGPALAAMVERFWQGPPGAAVTSVETSTTDLQERPAGFRITR